MIEVQDWLPIGSVVHIEGRDGLVMVISCMVGDEETGMLWDYAGLPYPQGLHGPNDNLMFDKDSIDHVFALGFQNEDNELMQDMLRDMEEDFFKEKEKRRGMVQ